MSDINKQFINFVDRAKKIFKKGSDHYKYDITKSQFLRGLQQGINKKIIDNKTRLKINRMFKKVGGLNALQGVKQENTFIEVCDLLLSQLKEHKMKKSELRQIIREEAHKLNELNFSSINRVEIIDKKGRSYVNTQVKEVKPDVQDNGKTLKLFIK